MKKKLFLLTIPVFVFLLLWLNLTSEVSDKITPSGKTIKVGMIGPLSGPFSAKGKNGLEGLEAALKFQPLLNNGTAIEFVVEDDRGKPTQTISALKKLVEIDQVAAVLVFSDSASVLALEPFVDRFKTPVIAILATHPEVSKHSKYLTQFCFDDVFQGSVAALFVRDELLVKRVAVFANPTNPYSARLAAEFRQKFVATGGQITEMVKISDEVGDLSAILQELRVQNSQLIYMPVQAECVTKVVKAARKIGWYPKMMGSDGLLATVMTKHRDKLELLEGLMATEFFSQQTSATLYEKRLRKVYHSLYRHPPTSYSALGAEVYAVLYDAMSRCLEPDKRQEIQAELRQTTEFLGIAGYISITKEGKTERPLFINAIKGERLEPIVKVY